MTPWTTLLLAILTLAQAPAPRAVAFDTADGGHIVADLYGQGGNAIVLAHGAQFNKESWKRQAETLAAQGHLVLAIDFRGYGQSTAGREDKALYQDVLAAVRYLRARGARTVGVLGGSMGGGASARAAAAAKAGEIDRLLLLSAVAIPNPQDMKAGRILFVASRDEPLAPSVEEQFAKAPEPKRIEWIEGSGHAQHIFEGGQAARLTTLISGFFAPGAP